MPEGQIAGEWVTVARLVKARGIKGELAADVLTSQPGRFESIRRARLFDPATEEPGPEVELENAWQHGDRVILKFSGIDTMSAAEPLAGMELRIPLADRPPLPEGEYYQTDLVGASLVSRDGTLLGNVTGWQNHGAGDLLVVRDGEHEFLVPFVKAICVDIDAAARRITAELPEGLKEL